MKKLGVDCGNTIFNEWFGFQVTGSVETLAKIVDSGEFEEVYVVSRANPLARLFFRIRLRTLNFYAATGIPRENLYFCKHYEDKADICATLGITDFVDDRLRVLHYLKLSGTRYAMNPRHRSDLRNYPDTLEEVTIVHSWKELGEKLGI